MGVPDRAWKNAPDLRGAVCRWVCRDPGPSGSAAGFQRCCRCARGTHPGSGAPRKIRSEVRGALPEVVLLEQPPEMAALGAGDARRDGHVAVGLIDQPGEIRVLEVGDRLFLRAAVGRLRTGLGWPIGK